MKRRMFLSAAGTVGLGTAVSSATIISSAFTSLSTSAALAEFPAASKTILEDFVAQLAKVVQENDLEKDYITNIAMPVRIIEKRGNDNIFTIVYKNKMGDYVSIIKKKHIEYVFVGNTL